MLACMQKPKYKIRKINKRVSNCVSIKSNHALDALSLYWCYDMLVLLYDFGLVVLGWR